MPAHTVTRAMPTARAMACPGRRLNDRAAAGPAIRANISSAPAFHAVRRGVQQLAGPVRHLAQLRQVPRHLQVQRQHRRVLAAGGEQFLNVRVAQHPASLALTSVPARGSAGPPGGRPCSVAVPEEGISTV
jgi:hypothetical protein